MTNRIADTMPQVPPANGRAPDAAPPPVTAPQTQTTTREISEVEEMAIRLMSLYDTLAKKEEEIANLKIDNANCRFQLNMMEKQQLVQKYGLQGQIKLEVRGDKRILTQTIEVPAAPPTPPPAGMPEKTGDSKSS